MTIVSQNRAPNDDEVTSLRRDVAAMTAQLKELAQVSEAEDTNARTASAPDFDSEEAIGRVANLEERRAEANAVLERYATPVRPQNSTSAPDARQASEAFQKVPYSIPGTSTIGEVWVEPVVTEDGELRFAWNFVIPSAEYQKVALSVPMTPDEIEQASVAFETVMRWSQTARDNGIRRAFEKVAACFPSERCGDAEGSHTNTMIMLRLGEDGSTSTVIKRTQGPLERFYAFSMESTDLLASYFRRVLDESRREYNAATATDEELNALFE